MDQRIVSHDYEKNLVDEFARAAAFMCSNVREINQSLHSLARTQIAQNELLDRLISVIAHSR